MWVTDAELLERLVRESGVAHRIGMRSVGSAP
jgi:hypothetical protein